MNRALLPQVAKPSKRVTFAPEVPPVNTPVEFSAESPPASPCGNLFIQTDGGPALAITAPPPMECVSTPPVLEHSLIDIDRAPSAPVVLSPITKSLTVPLFSGLLQLGERQIPSSRIMIDSGAAGFAYVVGDFRQTHKIPVFAKQHPVAVQTADGGPLGSGSIKHEIHDVSIRLPGHSELIPSLDVLPCSHADILLGAASHNPEIDWDKS